MEVYACSYDSPLGRMWMAGEWRTKEESVLTGLWFEDQRHFDAGSLTGAGMDRLPVFDQAAAWLDAYFAGNIGALSMPAAFSTGAEAAARREPPALPAFPPGAVPAALPASPAGTAAPLTISPPGTPFARQVWEVLRGIPYGQTRSYASVAAAVSAMRGGAFVSPRAVGQAVGRNPVSILIPCHRVVGKNGALTGYAGGLSRKKYLLELEAAVTSAGPPVS